MLAAPVAGAYTIRVHGVSVTQQAPGASPGAASRQDFALAVSNGVPTGAPPDDEEAVATTASMAFSGLRPGARPIAVAAAPGHRPVGLEQAIGSCRGAAGKLWRWRRTLRRRASSLLIDGGRTAGSKTAALRPTAAAR